jgi:predicted RNA-binding Zn-ribbon protein involved in translation (DUF1610 family)
MRCAACGYSWKVDDPSMMYACPACEETVSTPERCEACPVTEVEHYRSISSTGQLLDRVLEHDFDCKHYHMDPGSVSAEVREGLKILEHERVRWERETREKAEQEREEKRRIWEMQRRSGRGF